MEWNVKVIGINFCGISIGVDVAWLQELKQGRILRILVVYFKKSQKKRNTLHSL